MPRANRYNIPGQVWHLTHRCHEKKWLLRFSKDRRRWLYWLFEARKRYGLSVLNYVATSNHIHLLVKDKGTGEIGRSMQLIAGRTAQEYNRRKQRRGAFWEDRYHATAVQSDRHLHRCITYIDLNMVRAGAVSHPEYWPHGGFAELLQPRNRYTFIDEEALMSLLSIATMQQMLDVREQWVREELRCGKLNRCADWSESVAIGNEAYIRSLLPQVVRYSPGRKLHCSTEGHVLREKVALYGPVSHS